MTKEETFKLLKEDFISFKKDFRNRKLVIDNIIEEEKNKLVHLMQFSFLYPYISASILLKDILGCEDCLDNVISNKEQLEDYRKEINDFLNLISRQKFFKEKFIHIEEYEMLKQEISDLKDEIKPKNHINGHEFVDLGLPSGLKWATCNVGAIKPEGLGGYFAWGETSTKSSYTEENSKTYRLQFNDISGNIQFDAATANYGNTWRMPTNKEIQELIDKCNLTWTKQGCMNGYKVTGSNGNSIFIPAAGYQYRTFVYHKNEDIYYWCSNPSPSCNGDASFLSSFSGIKEIHNDHRYYGFTIRAVTE